MVASGVIGPSRAPLEGQTTIRTITVRRPRARSLADPLVEEVSRSSPPPWDHGLVPVPPAWDLDETSHLAKRRHRWNVVQQRLLAHPGSVTAWNCPQPAAPSRRAAS